MTRKVSCLIIPIMQSTHSVQNSLDQRLSKLCHKFVSAYSIQLLNSEQTLHPCCARLTQGSVGHTPAHEMLKILAEPAYESKTWPADIALCYAHDSRITTGFPMRTYNDLVDLSHFYETVQHSSHQSISRTNKLHRITGQLLTSQQ